MTPLARWVLLALLLVVVEAHPYEHACVCLCCVQNGGPNIAEVCDDQRIQDLQSGASLHVVRDTLCPIPDKPPQSSVWNELLSHGCSCDNYRLYKLPEEFENTLDMLNKADNEAEDQRGWNRNISEAMADVDSCKEIDSMEDSIDWEVWCTTQCKNGQGACNCDIIP